MQSSKCKHLSKSCNIASECPYHYLQGVTKMPLTPFNLLWDVSLTLWHKNSEWKCLSLRNAEPLIIILFSDEVGDVLTSPHLWTVQAGTLLHWDQRIVTLPSLFFYFLKNESILLSALGVVTNSDSSTKAEKAAWYRKNCSTVTHLL